MLGCPHLTIDSGSMACFRSQAFDDPQSTRDIDYVTFRASCLDIPFLLFYILTSFQRLLP